MPKKKGKFIVIEGADGSGKSTLAASLATALSGATLFREPTTTSPFAARLRAILTGEIKADTNETRKLFMDDRLWDIENNIEPSLLKNRYTILDRYYYSTAAYQGKDQRDIEEFINLNLHMPEIRQPDVVFYLKISADESLKRLTLRNKSLEIFEKKDELKRIIENYDKIFSRFDLPSIVYIVDARAPQNEILNLVLRKISLIE